MAGFVMRLFQVLLLFSSTAVFASIDPSGFLECLTEAKKDYTNFDLPIRSAEDASHLCKGASSKYPVECVKAAKRDLQGNESLLVGDNEVLHLCQGAKSAAVLDCAKATLRDLRSFGSVIPNREEAIRICQISGSIESFECLKKMHSEKAANKGSKTLLSDTDIFNACTLAVKP